MSEEYDIHSERLKQDRITRINERIKDDATDTSSQGLCETTLTERFFCPGCKCGTYPDNLGPCKTWEAGRNPERCVYCDHKIECHEAVATATPALEFDALASELLGWREPENPSDDARRMVWLMHKAGEALRLAHADKLAYEARIEKLERENERLRKALAPFAEAAREFSVAIAPDGNDDGLTVFAHIHVMPKYEASLSTSDFSNAKAALAGREG